MEIDSGRIYPNCPVIIRMVEVGGLTKSELLQKLKEYSVRMNESGDRLFADDRFTTSIEKCILQTVELTVDNLGFSEGGTLSEIFARATKLGLELCPLELGPHLRLAYLDQPEGSSGKPSRLHQAPFGSITIASETLSEDDDFPKGFYLRRIEGVLWLRGYHATNLYVWKPDDHLIFCQSMNPMKKVESERKPGHT